MNNNDTAEKSVSKKRIVCIAVLVVIAAVFAVAVCFRTNPKWKAAELTIEPAGRFFEIQSLDPDGMKLDSR